MTRNIKFMLAHSKEQAQQFIKDTLPDKPCDYLTITVDLRDHDGEQFPSGRNGLRIASSQYVNIPDIDAAGKIYIRNEEFQLFVRDLKGDAINE